MEKEDTCPHAMLYLARCLVYICIVPHMCFLKPKLYSHRDKHMYISANLQDRLHMHCIILPWSDTFFCRYIFLSILLVLNFVDNQASVWGYILFVCTNFVLMLNRKNVKCYYLLIIVPLRYTNRWYVSLEVLWILINILNMLLYSRAISEDHPEGVQMTVDCLSSNLTSVYDAHRVTVVSFYSEVGGVTSSFSV